MAEQRQDSIRAHESAAFQGAHGHQDIAVLKLTIYELANTHGIMDLVILDEDMEELGIEERQDVIARPQRPAHGANQAAVNEYKIEHAEWKEQSKAILEVKQALVDLLDGHAKKVVSDPIQGTLMRTTTEMLELLVQQYHAMSNEELRAMKTTWSSTRWNQGEDLITFLSNFNDAVIFLETHDYGPPRGEQVTTLFQAIDHVPTLVAPTKAAFYQAAPLLADQTLETLCEQLRTVYRTQYVQTTAAEHHAVNQAVLTPTDANAIIVDGIAASARATLHGETISAAQLELMQAAVTKAIKQCLAPPSQAKPAQAKPEQRRRPQQDPRQRAKKMEAGECPMHRGAFHRWEDCFSNPDRVSKQK